MDAFWEKDLDEVDSSKKIEELRNKFKDAEKETPYRSIENRSGYKAYISSFSKNPLYSKEGILDKDEIKRRIEIASLVKKLCLDGPFDDWFENLEEVVKKDVLNKLPEEEKWKFETLLNLYTQVFNDSLKCAFSDGIVAKKFLDKIK